MLQPWFVELMSVLSDAIVGLSAIIVALIAVYGFKQWRIELRGKSQFEIARLLAKYANQFKDEYKRARNPFTKVGESAKRQKDVNETPEKTHLLDEFYARHRRLRPLQQTLGNLYTASWEADIILNEDISELIRPLEDAFKELYVAIQAFFSTKLERARSGQKNPDMDDWFQSKYKIIYGPEDDDYSKNVDTAVDNLLAELKKYIK